MLQAIDKLEYRVGSLYDIYSEFENGTVLTSNELTDIIVNPKYDDESLRTERMWTSDFVVFRIINGEVVLSFVNQNPNPIFQNIRTYTHSLLRGKPCLFDNNYLNDIILPETSLNISMNELELNIQDSITNLYETEFYSYFTIKLNALDILNNSQRSLAERIYGQGVKFERNMKYFLMHGEKEKNIYLLPQKYIINMINEDYSCALLCSKYYTDFILGDDRISSKNRDMMCGKPINTINSAKVFI